MVEVVAHYDNSAANPDNPDPNRDVGFGFQSTDEMMVGIFDADRSRSGRERGVDADWRRVSGVADGLY